MGLFGSNNEKKARKAYEAKLGEAQRAQRAGKIVEYSELMEEAEVLRKALEEASGS